MAPPQVLIVGAGVTGSVLALLARDAGLSVKVVEKARSAGGRMSTYNLRGQAPGEVLGSADLGAQYITTQTSPDHPELGPLYARLLGSGALRPFTGEVTGPNPYGGRAGTVRHFSAPAGLQALPATLLAASGVAADCGQAVQEISIDESGRVSLKVGSGDFAPEEGPLIVVLTQPVQQVLGESKFPVRGNFLQHTEPAVMAALKQVSYSSRFAAAYFFDAASFEWPYSWTARYFDTGDVRYIAFDTKKRGAEGEPMASVLVHSGVPLGIELMDEEDPFPTASARLLSDLAAKLPEVDWRSAAKAKVHKWRYSQVYKGYGGLRPNPAWEWGTQEGATAAEAAPGCVTLFRTPAALGLLGGDALAPSSNFEGCVFSAHRTLAAIRSYVAEHQARQ